MVKVILIHPGSTEYDLENRIQQAQTVVDQQLEKNAPVAELVRSLKQTGFVLMALEVLEQDGELPQVHSTMTRDPAPDKPEEPEEKPDMERDTEDEMYAKLKAVAGRRKRKSK